MLAWLASYPRSGNTFFRVLLKRIYDISSYDLHEPHPERPEYEDIIGNAKLNTALSELHRDTRYHVVKTHEMPRDDYPAIYILRDGRDAVVSYARFALHSGHSGAERNYHALLRRLIESPDSYGGWSGHVRTWMSRQAPTVLVRFDDLIARPVEEVRRSLHALGFAPQETGNSIPTFGDLQKLSPHFFPRGRTGGWRDDMTLELHRVFWQRHGDTMRDFGYRDGEPGPEELVGGPFEHDVAVNFGSGSRGRAMLGEGWGEPEEWGTWSIHKHASLHFAIGQRCAVPLQIELHYRSFIEGQRSIDVSCRARGKLISSWTCRVENWRGLQKLDLPPEAVAPSGIVTLEFDISEPRSPAELGLSPDTRQLGLGIESMTLCAARVPVENAPGDEQT